MTKEQKEEYDYRFKEKRPIFTMNGVCLLTIVLSYTFLMSTFAGFLMVTHEKFEGKEAIGMELITYVAKSSIVILVFTILGVFSQLTQMIIYGITETYWMKKNKIKIIRWWNKSKIMF